ncbi:biotin--[acetyl-CoA-carboxylase] ligase [Mumia sp. zg.B21]|uniref:biotin--[acetyl-CoA-carboxylase] ligase n=1 Tax=Mumia sp. zg.B21 TaxID=2855447 RepID=UPI001C6EAB75|nr:biotin--[acetyl-CoA-carboxylase] ligase [Mumia sp. zg.B21]MBW9209143.1 biotin--[acetyl-CoA-carboxylase] ligase [Mumia sp. zg.B21]
MSDSPPADSPLARRPLDAAGLEQALIRPTSWWQEVRVVPETASTNADLARLAREGAPEGTLLTTDHQTAGRGRLDRTWEMPRYSALAVSVLVRPRIDGYRWTWLPLLTGAAVVATVRQAGVVAQLKWPNDVVVEDRKLAGILVERVDTPTGPAAVVGCGINVSTTPEEIGVPNATSLTNEGSPTAERTGLLSGFAAAFEALYVPWADAGGDPDIGIRQAYERSSATLGREVSVELPDGQRIEGEAVGLDDSGRLEISVNGEVTTVSAGDITHLRSRA